VIALHVPYSETSVTILINPQVGDFVENNDQSGIKVGNLILLEGTFDSKALQFDLTTNNTRQVTCNCKVYELKLMRIGKETVDGQAWPFFEFLVKQVKTDARFLREGSVTYWLRSKQENWATDENEYKFPNVNEQGIEIETAKTKDKTLSVVIRGPLKRMFTFRSFIPPCDSRGLFVVITWKDPEVNLYLNAKQNQKLNVRDGVKLEL
jgi:hypothetical protein